MRLILFSLFYLPLSLSAQEAGTELDLVSPSRLWKSANGSTIAGSLLFSDDKRVVIKTDGRGPIVLQPQQLSAEDRAYLDKWKTEKMTYWAQKTLESDDQGLAGSVVIIPKYDRPVRIGGCPLYR